MAFQRFLPKTLPFSSSSVFSRSFFTSIRTPASYSADSSVFSLIRRLRPLTVAAHVQRVLSSNTVRSLSTRATSSSLNDPNPNWSNRPPKETILLEGCDFEHWLVVMEKPEGEPTRDEIIDSYIKTLAMVVGSEEDARMKIYSVSTRCYFAFGALVSEELSYKIKELPNVRWVLPDSYLDVRNKNYGGEPFIDGQAVPYDPKYHEEWIRNNARANERNRRNDRPRNFDRSRNFERRRENMQNRDFQNPSPAMQNPGPGPGPNISGAPPNMSGMPPNNMAGVPPNNMGGAPSSNYGRMPPNNMGGIPTNNMGVAAPPYNMGGGPPNNMGVGPPNNMGVGPPPNNMGGAPSSNYGRMPPNNMGGIPTNNMGGVAPTYNMGGGPPNNMGGGSQNLGDMPPYNYGGGIPQHNRLNMPPPSPPSPPPPPHNFGVSPNNMGGAAANFGAMPISNMGGMPSNTGPVPEREQQNGYNARSFPGGNSYSS